MDNRAKRIAAVTGLGLAGAAVVIYVVGAGLSAELLHRIGAGSSHSHAVSMCSSASNVSPPTFYSEMVRANARMHAGMEIAPSGSPDHDFARMMIPHHQGAIDMAVVQLKYGRDQRLKRLAQSIIVEQGQEIAYMRTLLDAPPGQIPAPNHVAAQ